MKNLRNCPAGNNRRSKTAQNQPGEPEELPFTILEQVALLRALSRGTGQGFTEAEATKVMVWATCVRKENCLLELVLTGWAKINFRDDGELIFNAVEPESILPQNQLKPTTGRKTR